MLPCEVRSYKTLPAIRAQVALELKSQGFKSAEIAKLLHVTPAAVSQYITGKRKFPKILDDDTLNDLVKSTKEGRFDKVICEICSSF